jgi:uncharacterized protein (TIGR02646 family)
MRYIDTSHFSPSPEWLGKAKQKTDELLACANRTARKQILDAKNPLWRNPDFKQAFETLSHKKCWYCETDFTRANADVDHFRPQKKVTECPNHEGYWWLAFEWTNYRLSCEWCNRLHKDRVDGQTGGKSNFFDTSDKNWATTPSDNIAAEKPMLIDPTVATDCALLWFEQDGRCVCRTDAPEDVDRVKYSKKVYNLDAQAIKGARQKLYREIKQKIDNGDAHWAQYEIDTNDVQKAHLLVGIIRILREYVADSD